MIFMAQVYHPAKLRDLATIFLTTETPIFIVAAPTKKSGLASALTLANPTQPTPNPLKKEESTMPDDTITDTHTKGETPYTTVKLNPYDIQPRDWEFLREWANNLGVSIEVLLKRILIAAIIGQLYAEKIPEI
jgi:hypothetical protein